MGDGPPGLSVKDDRQIWMHSAGSAFSFDRRRE
jgi:hypothetical protein